MAALTLKTLHTHLKLLENSSELKRRMPTSPNPRSMKEGLYEISRLAGLDPAALKHPPNLAALVGAQRFVMIWGEASVTDHVARVFDSSRVLLTVVIDPGHFQNATPGAMGPTSGTAQAQAAARGALPAGRARAADESPFLPPAADPGPETSPDSLVALLSGNTALTCRLFRALFEHMLGFVSRSSAQQGNVFLISELAGSREHSRSFLSTALFILGAELDPQNLMPFMMQQGLFGLPIFEHMLQHRDYCDAFLDFRRLERAFMGASAAEEAHLRSRLEKLNAQCGAGPPGAEIIEAGERDRASIDACLAATDLLEALAHTPWRMSLNQALGLDPANSARSVSAIATLFEGVSRGATTRDQANRGITDHLLSFAMQFSADRSPAPTSPGE